jgi:AcrR family transcriptional regulator
MQEVRKRKIGIIKSFRRNLERPKSEEIAAKAEILYRENKLEVADIAEKLNITKNTLYSYLRYKNVPLHKSNKAYRQWISKSKSEPTAAKAEALYREEKLTVDEIAEKLGISSGTLYHYLHYRNVPTNRKSRSVSKSKVIGAKAEILYRENKLTVAEIAKKLSITPPTLYRCLRYRNVPIDKKSRAHAKWLSQFKATAARAEILYRKNKLTVAEITKKLGIAQPTLYQSLHYGNVPINKRSRVHSKWLSQFKATTAKAEILYRKNKLTVAKITKKLGISQPTLYRYLRYKNVPINRSSRMLSKSKTIAAKAEMLYRENKLAVTDITKKLGIGTGTLYRYLRYKNVPLNRANIALSKSKTIGTKAEILYRKNKLTVAEIAKELGIATGTLYRYLRYRKVALKRSSRVYKME